MAIERLPERKKWHEIYKSASAYFAASSIPKGKSIICYENTKECRLQGIILCAPRQMLFNIVVRDQDGSNPYVRKRYRLQSAGMIVDRAEWPNSLLKWGANKEICVLMAMSGASAEVFSADLELLELMG